MSNGRGRGGSLPRTRSTRTTARGSTPFIVHDVLCEGTTEYRRTSYQKLCMHVTVRCADAGVSTPRAARLASASPTVTLQQTSCRCIEVRAKVLKPVLRQTLPHQTFDMEILAQCYTRSGHVG